LHFDASDHSSEVHWRGADNLRWKVGLPSVAQFSISLSEGWLAIRSSVLDLAKRRLACHPKLAHDSGERRMVPVRGYAKGCSPENIKFVGTAA
jgi:hypothetical protein